MPVTASSLASPGSDDPHEASAVFNQVMQSTTALTDALTAIVRRHGGTARVSTNHVQDLLATLSTEILDWIWRWPS